MANAATRERPRAKKIYRVEGKKRTEVLSLKLVRGFYGSANFKPGEGVTIYVTSETGGDWIMIRKGTVINKGAEITDGNGRTWPALELMVSCSINVSPEGLESTSVYKNNYHGVYDYRDIALKTRYNPRKPI